MKKILWSVAIIGWLCYGSYRIQQYFANMESPSEVGQMILDSMETGEGWTDIGVGKYANYKLNLRIVEGVIFADVTLQKQDECIEEITKADKYWINKKLPHLRIVHKQKLDEEKTRDAVKAKQEFVPKLKETLKRSDP